MGYSIQDIDTRLRVVEDKLDLVMQVASVTKRTPGKLATPDGEPTYVMERLSLADLYRELRTSGTQLEAYKDTPDGTDI